MSAMGGLIDLISRGGSYAAGLENDRVKAATKVAEAQAAVQEEERLKMQREAEAAKRAQEDQNILTMAMREPGMNRKRMSEYLLQKMSPAGFHNWRKQDMEMEKSAAALDEFERKRQSDLHTKAGQILAAVAASKDPLASYVQAHPQLQALGSDFQFPGADQFDQEQLPFMIGALGYADDFLKQRQGEATVEKTQQDIKTAAQKALEEQREAFVSQLRPDMSQTEYDALRSQYPVSQRFPSRVGQWIAPAMKTAIAMRDRAKAEQEALVLAGMSQDGVTAAKKAELAAQEIAREEQIRHNKASEALTARGQSMTDARSREMAEIARDNKPPSSAEQRAAGFWNRAQEAEKNLSKLESSIEKMGTIDRARMRFAPNWAQSDEGQSYNQSQRAFIEAVLRKDSGAAIPPAEYTSLSMTYFPQVGDGPDILKQKKAARDTQLRSLKAEAGRGIKAYGEEYHPDGAAPNPNKSDPLGIR